MPNTKNKLVRDTDCYFVRWARGGSRWVKGIQNAKRLTQRQAANVIAKCGNGEIIDAPADSAEMIPTPKRALWDTSKPVIDIETFAI